MWETVLDFCPASGSVDCVHSGTLADFVDHHTLVWGVGGLVGGGGGGAIPESCPAEELYRMCLLGGPG